MRSDFDSVQVTFTAGFPGTGDSPVTLENVPASLIHAQLMLIGHWYENRETSVIGEVPAELQQGFDHLANRFRVGRF